MYEHETVSYRTMALQLLIAVMALALPVASGASSLLGVQESLDGTLIDFDSGGMVDYKVGTGIFTVDATVLPPSVGIESCVVNCGGPLRLEIELDQTGALVDGLNAVTVLSPSGTTLLTADVTAFGYLAGQASTDQFDFLLDVTGGTAASEFGDSVGMFTVVDSTCTNCFTGDFAADFDGMPAKGGIGNVVPEPSAALLSAIVLGFVGLRARRH
jgi:hypothetical protein